MLEFLVRDLTMLVAALTGASLKKQVELLRDMVSRIHRAANHLEAKLREEVVAGSPTEELVRDLKNLTEKLPGLTTKRQVEELNIIAATAKWVADRLNADLARERRLKEAG